MGGGRGESARAEAKVAKVERKERMRGGKKRRKEERRERRKEWGEKKERRKERKEGRKEWGVRKEGRKEGSGQGREKGGRLICSSFNSLLGFKGSAQAPSIVMDGSVQALFSYIIVMNWTERAGLVDEMVERVRRFHTHTQV